MLRLDVLLAHTQQLVSLILLQPDDLASFVNVISPNPFVLQHTVEI
jgi:hypothetical protein